MAKEIQARGAMAKIAKDEASAAKTNAETQAIDVNAGVQQQAQQMQQVQQAQPPGIDQQIDDALMEASN